MIDDVELWDLVTSLERRAEVCRNLIPERDPQDRARLEGKAAAYYHAAKILAYELRPRGL